MSLGRITAPRRVASQLAPLVSRNAEQQRFSTSENQKQREYPKVQAIREVIERQGLEKAPHSLSSQTFSRDMGEEAESSKSSSIKRLLDHAMSDSRSNPQPHRPQPSSSTPAPRSTSWPASIANKFTPAWNLRNPATFRDPDAPPRIFKGVHNRQKRAAGNTPAEAMAINALMESMLQSSMLAVPNSRGPIAQPGSDTLSRSRLYSPLPFSPSPSGRRISPRILERMEMEEDFALTEQLDALKEDMGSCRTDVDLIKWAKEKVFAPLPSDPSSTEVTGPTFPPVYPKILAHLLGFIRRNYANPHLVLALFHHAKTQSPESYVSGCLAPAYNQVLKTQWESFKDLEAVEAGIREMEMNGVAWDRETARTVGKVVDEIGKDVWQGTGWQEKYGEDVHERLARLEDRLQKDVNDQNRMYERKVREKASMRLFASRAEARRGSFVNEQEGEGRTMGTEA